MVYAEYQNSIIDYKRFCRFHLLKARGIKTYIVSLLFFVFGVFFIIMAVTVQNPALYGVAVILFGLAIALPFLYLWLQNVKINKRFRGDQLYEKIKHFFVFSENGLRLTIKAKGKEEDYEIPYSQMLRVYERNDVFYIYIGAMHALIIPKIAIREDQKGELKDYFCLLGKHFKGNQKLSDNIPCNGEDK